MPPLGDELPQGLLFEPVEDDPFITGVPSSGNILDPASQPVSPWADSPIAKVGRLVGERGLAGAIPKRAVETLPDFWQRWHGMIGGLIGKPQAAAINEKTNVDNFTAAKDTLNLTPQEQALYRRHQENLTGPGGIDNPNGSRSTLYQAVVEHDGMFYSIPTVWDGKIVQPADAARRVTAEGWDKFPSYATPDAADTRYAQMHGFMEKDTEAYMRSRNKPQVSSDQTSAYKLVPVDHDPFTGAP